MPESSPILDAAQRGGTLGAQALLFLGLIVLGVVIVQLDKRREAARSQERAELKGQFEIFVKHHADAVAAFNIERANIQAERTFMRDTLVRIIAENTQAFIAMREFLAARKPA